MKSEFKFPPSEVQIGTQAQGAKAGISPLIFYIKVWVSTNYPSEIESELTSDGTLGSIFSLSIVMLTPNFD